MPRSGANDSRNINPRCISAGSSAVSALMIWPSGSFTSRRLSAFRLSLDPPPQPFKASAAPNAGASANPHIRGSFQAIE